MQKYFLKHEKWIVADTDKIFDYYLMENILISYVQKWLTAQVKKECKCTQRTEIFVLFTFVKYNNVIDEYCIHKILCRWFGTEEKFLFLFDLYLVYMHFKELVVT